MSKSDDRLVITTQRRYGKWAEWNRHRNEAAKFAPLGVDYSGPASRQPRVEVTRDATHVLRCAKCEGESSGTARGAGSPCECGGSLSLYRKLEPEPQRPTYRIPAREVVPGMMYVLQNRRGQTIQITAVERAGDEVILWRGQAGRGFLRHELVDIQLPGPSPRELACTCEAWEPCMFADIHVDGCPVAPVPGRHGGMRIWPAPWRGVAWKYENKKYHTGTGMDAYVWEIGNAGRGEDGPAGHQDMVMQCFYLPPVPQEERREPTPWAPHAGVE